MANDREQQAVVDALGSGAFSSLCWTLVRAGVNSRGKNERPVASEDWDAGERTRASQGVWSFGGNVENPVKARAGQHTRA